MSPARAFRLSLPFVLMAALAVVAAAAGARAQTVGFEIGPLQTLPGDWRGYQQLYGDVNGDGRTDLIWNRVDDGNFSNTYAGLAGDDGIFDLGSVTSIAADWRTYQVYAGDFNDDGLTDLLWNSKCQDVGCVNSANFVIVGLSNGDGTFAVQPRQVLGISGWAQYRTRIADVNGDGYEDVVFNYVGNGFSDTSPGANLIYVALSNENALFTLQPLQTVGLSGWDNFNVTTGDVDGDGRADLIWSTQCIVQELSSEGACWLGVNNRVAIGKSTGSSFQVSPPQAIGDDGTWSGYEIHQGDVNGDGRLDLIWRRSSGADANALFIGLGTAAGSLVVGEQQVVDGRGFWSELRLLDTSADGKDELVFNSICQARLSEPPFTCTAGRNLITIGHVDNDGLVTADPEQELPAADLETLQLAPRHPAADYNGDGQEDLLWSSAANTILVGLAVQQEYRSHIPLALAP